MSLFKQLFVAICLLLLVNFTGSFLLGLKVPASSRSTSCVHMRRMQRLRWACRSVRMSTTRR